MRAKILKADIPNTKQLVDPFTEYYAKNIVLEPPYNLEYLQQIRQYSTILWQCIEAYKTNVAGFGYHFELRGEPDKINEKEAEAELDKLEEIFKYPHFSKDFTKILSEIVEDRERTGNAYLEVIRNPAGEIVGFERIPAHTVRCTNAERVVIDKTLYTPKGEKRIRTTVFLRRYLQVVGTRRVWFKEFGDPRTMNYETGEFEDCDYSKQASELIHFKIEEPTSPYGIPRYIGALLSILGSRKAEELNYYYFDNGKHIPMAILVQNGMLTESSIEKIQEYLNDTKGIENAHKFLVLEGVGTGINENSKIELVPLTESLQQDALFIDYDSKNRDKVRSAFRLPPIFVGETTDYTRATAKESYRVAVQQVFRPLQVEIELLINRLILNDLGINYWNFRLNTPELADTEEIIDAINNFKDTGAVTVNIARETLGKLLKKDLPKIEEEWADIPVNILLEQLRLGYQKPIGSEEKEDAIAKIIKALRELRTNEHKFIDVEI